MLRSRLVLRSQLVPARFDCLVYAFVVPYLLCSQPQKTPVARMHVCCPYSIVELACLWDVFLGDVAGVRTLDHIYIPALSLCLSSGILPAHVDIARPNGLESTLADISPL